MGKMKGSNGIQDGQRNVEVFLSWAACVEDFKPFIHQGLLSVARVARECGLNRDVFYSNPDIRDVHWPALVTRLEAEGVLLGRVASPAPVVARPPKADLVGAQRIKQIQDENEAVKTENRTLRAKLNEALAQLERQGEQTAVVKDVLNTTGRLPW